MLTPGGRCAKQAAKEQEQGMESTTAGAISALWNDVSHATGGGFPISYYLPTDLTNSLKLH